MISEIWGFNSPKRKEVRWRKEKREERKGEREERRKRRDREGKGGYAII